MGVMRRLCGGIVFASIVSSGLWTTSSQLRAWDLTQYCNDLAALIAQLHSQPLIQFLTAVFNKYCG